MTLILGSQSPRRREILGYFSLPFEQISSSFDEDSVPYRGDPCAYANALSKGKAETLALSFPGRTILTADTIVYYDNKVYGKPKNDDEAFDYLKTLIGKWHQVYTSLTIKKGSEEFQAIEETRVLFNRLTDEQIRLYYQALPYHDKAGGYTIQQAGGIIVNKIEGAYDNVMGLPVNTLRYLLKQVGIDLWDYLPT